MSLISELPSPAVVTKKMFGDEPAWILEQSGVGSILVAERGATLLRWWRPGSEDSLVDGYSDEEEFHSNNGYRNAILAPWSNRIRNGKYKFSQVSYDLGIDRDGNPEALHGIAVDQIFERDAEISDVLSFTTIIEPTKGYPFKVALRVTFSLVKGAENDIRLSLEVAATNLSQDTAPIGLGWHPYLKLPESNNIDGWVLRLPARSHVLVDEKIIPLPGDAAWAGDVAPVTFDTLEGKVLDRAYTDLIPGDDGVTRSFLMDPRTGHSIAIVQAPMEVSVVHVFTGDTLNRDPRKSVAVEPCTHITDAFNRPELANSIGVKPGQTRQFTCDLVYKHLFVDEQYWIRANNKNN